MGQDAYGSVLNVSRGDHLFPVPDLAVGRLIETATEVTAILQAFPNGGTLQLQRPPIVTGYDFMADGARKVREELDLASGGGALATQRQVTVTKNGTPRTYDLIHEGAGEPWTADALRAAWLDTRHDITFLGAHFSESFAQAADGLTLLRAEDLENASADLRNTIILGQGCHLGYNLVDPDGFALQPTLDWAQAAARRGVGAFIAGTGYQFGAGPDVGDHGDIIEYGERLYVDIAKQLRAGSPGTVSIGHAFIEGKRDYLAVVGSYLGSLHEKQLGETTLFGLPMLSVSFTGTPPASGTVQPVAPDAQGDITIGFSGLRTLESHGGFDSGPFGTLGVPALPILPVDLADASTAGILRGVGFREGSYTDTEGFHLTISSPVTESTASLAHAYRSSVFSPLPNRLATVNYLGALARATTYLVVTPSEYRSASAMSDTGTLRRFDSLKLRLYYRTSAESSLEGPPSFVDIRATPNGTGGVLFEAFVIEGPGIAIDEVWVTHTSATGAFPRMWTSVDLRRCQAASAECTNPQAGYWKTTQTLAQLGVESIDDVVFIAQAASHSGLVGFATNGGNYYGVSTPVATTATPKLVTDLTITIPSSATSGAYRTTQTFRAHLQDRTLERPLAGKTVGFALGSQRLSAVTDANGDASISLKLLQSPGPYKLRAAFDEDDAYLGSAATREVTITRASSSLALGTLNVVAGGRWSSMATLSIGGAPATDTQTAYFVATSGTQTFVTSALTGPSGAVSIPDWDLIPGTYTLTAYFAESVPLGGGATFNATSRYYVGDHKSGTLTVGAAGVTFIGDTVVPLGTNVKLKAAVTPPGGASNAAALVRYVVRRADTLAFSSAPVAKGVSGDWLTTIVGGLPVGVYAIRTTIVGTDYDGEGITAYLSVYDPNGGFVTGGGWINSPAGAFRADVTRTGRATFGFNAKYKKGSNEVTGDTEFQFSAGDMKFKSSSHDAMSLVIAGRKALYKGTGTINGTGSYKFMLSAIDGQANNGVDPDTFRIRIWDAGGTLVYDNQPLDGEEVDPTTTLGGGSIVVHK